LLESVNNFIPAVLYVLFAAVLCVGLIGAVRLFRALINAGRALEQMGRAMEDIAGALKKDRDATQATNRGMNKEEIF
jgi:hypothetical protein